MFFCCMILRVLIPQCWCNSFSPKNASLSFTTHHTPQICLPLLFCIPEIEVRFPRSPICGYRVSSTECSRGIEGNFTSRLQFGDEGIGSTRTMVYQCRGEVFWIIWINLFFGIFFVVFVRQSWNFVATPCMYVAAHTPGFKLLLPIWRLVQPSLQTKSVKSPVPDNLLF